MKFLIEHGDADQALGIQITLSNAGITSKLMVDPLSARLSPHAEFCQTGIFVNEKDFEKAKELISGVQTFLKAA